MASAHFSPSSPPMFDGQNYPIWSIKMKAYLQAYDLWDLVEKDHEPEPEKTGLTANQQKLLSESNARPFKALSALQAAVSNDIFTRIMTCETPKQAWERLQEEFQGNKRTKQMQLLNLRREFENLKMEDDDAVKDFSNKCMKVVNQIRLLGETFHDQRVVEKILICLPERFESKISSLEETRDLSQLSLAELINALQATEQRRSLRLQGEYNSNEAALAATNKGKPCQNQGKEPAPTWENKRQYGPCTVCKKKGHTAKVCWWRPNVQCKVCNQFGHIDKVCRQRRPREDARHVEEPVEEDEQPVHTFTATCNLETTSKDAWILDSGCTNHMCKNRDQFITFDERIATKIRVANGKIMQAQGMGDLIVKTPKGKIKITNVLYVPSLSENLLSIPQLMKKGYALKFLDTYCEITKNEQVVQVVHFQNNSLVIDFNQPRHADLTTKHNLANKKNIGQRGRELIADLYEKASLATHDQHTYSEAAQHKEMYAATKEELWMKEKNGTWSKVSKPSDAHVIKGKMVYKAKLKPDGTLNKHKAMLVDKGNVQQRRTKHIPVKYHSIREAEKLAWCIVQHNNSSRTFTSNICQGKTTSTSKTSQHHAIYCQGGVLKYGNTCHRST